MCRMCKRQVVDLSPMSDAQRVAFLENCSGEVCVSYKFSVRPALAAAAIAVASIAVPTAAAACDTSEVVVTVGGIKDPKNVQFVEDPSDSAIPVLPVVYEDKPKSDTTIGLTKAP